MSAPKLDWEKRTHAPFAHCFDCAWVMRDRQATAWAKQHAARQCHEVMVEHTTETTYHGATT